MWNERPVELGNNFSWNVWRNKKWIQCKLDKCVGNKEWLLLFPSSIQTFMPKRGFDHIPVFQSLKSSHDTYIGFFRFDCRMLNYLQVRYEVCNAWGTSGTGRGASVFDMIRDSWVALSWWKKDSEANSKSRLTKLQYMFDKEQSKLDPFYKVM